MSETGFTDDLKRNLLTGVAAVFPVLVTLFLFTWLGRQLHNTVGKFANWLCASILAEKSSWFEFFFPDAPREITEAAQRAGYVSERFPQWVATVLGLTVAVVLVYMLGGALRSFIGRRAMQVVDRFFNRFPVIKMVYPHARQVGDFIFGQSGQHRFSNVVAVQYPRRGVYTLGFRTGDAPSAAEKEFGKELASVFIPTSPTPLTGFVVMVPCQEVVPLDMTVDEAFRFCITAGMLSRQTKARNVLPGEMVPRPEETNGDRGSQHSQASPTPNEA